jgi:Uma2 family endonuclease
MSKQLNYSYSPEEYLALERKADKKHEYINGEIYDMAGDNEVHNIICGNIFAELHIHLRNSPCKVYNSDMKVGLARNRKFHYPDVTIVCGEVKFNDVEKDVVTNPLVLVEVLSDSTAAYDRGKKFQYYQQINSFREYILIAQDEPVIERLVKQETGGWLYTKFEGLENSIYIESIDAHISIQNIYAKTSVGM